MECYFETSGGNIAFLGSAFPEVLLDTTIGLAESDISQFFLLVKNRELQQLLPEKYQKIQNLLHLHDELMIVPKIVLKNRQKLIMGEIESIQECTEDMQYLVTYLQIKEFLRGLSRAHVDKAKIEKLMLETTQPGVKNTINSFSQESDKFLKKIVYSTTKTATGRLTVLSGPKILTAPGKIKSCLASTFKKGKILQIDLISAEPKFALQIKGDTIPSDVYLDISKNILENKITRKQAKLITLCALYGQSPIKLKDQLPKELNATIVIKKVREYFGYYDLLAQLKQDYRNNNFRNALGRPIKLASGNEHLLISYYLQSSIAEGSILMFADFVDKFSDFCKPNFVIHDALILDCEEQFANKLLEKKKVALLLGDWQFSADIKNVRDI